MGKLPLEEIWYAMAFKEKKKKSSEGISLFTLKETSNCLCKQHLGNEERESLGQKGMNKTDTFLHLFEKNN